MAAAALGWLAEALQIPTLSQSSSCHSVQRWALMGQQGQPWGPGPRGGLWPGAMQGREGQTCWEVWAGAVGVLGACPSRPSLQLLGQQADSPSRPQRTCSQPLWAASPAPEGGMHGVLSSPLSVSPQWGQKASTTTTTTPNLPRELARPSPTSGNFHQRNLEADVHHQERPEVTEIGGNQAVVDEPAAGVLIP